MGRTFTEAFSVILCGINKGDRILLCKTECHLYLFTNVKMHCVNVNFLELIPETEIRYKMYKNNSVQNKLTL